MPAVMNHALKVYRTALYGRLSVLDNGKLDGDSLESQIELMERFVGERPYLQYCKLYQDNGFTGTNFRRPAWDALMRDVSEGRIDCIVVKDLSRLGRNYIEAGEFLEKDCPRLGLRFISINDGYDSAALGANEGLTAALKNIVNDYYAKDISRKVCTALETKRSRGEYLGSYAPYGYRKDPSCKNRLVIDPVTAPVVRDIFGRRAAGAGYGAIARYLNEQDIPSPGRYRFEQGIITNNNKKGSALLWNRHVLTELLHDPVYIGDLEQGKCRASLYQGIPIHRTDRKDWSIALQTHEPIIGKELFDAVQQVNERHAAAFRANLGRHDDLPKETNPYGKKLVCADCGAQLKLYRSIAHDGKRGYYSYLCPVYEEHRALRCRKKSIRTAALDEAVLAAVKVQIGLFLSSADVLASLVREQAGKRRRSDANKQRALLKKQIERKESLSSALYMDWKNGVLTREEYRFAKERYAAELEQLRHQLAELDSTQPQEQLTAAEHWSSLLKQYSGAERVTKELVDALIDRISLDAAGGISVCFRFDDARRMLDAEIQKIKGAA